MRSMLNAERLKKIQIHQALFRSAWVTFFSAGALVLDLTTCSAMLRLRSSLFQPGEIEVVDDGQEGAENGDCHNRQLQIDHQGPSQQEPGQHAVGRGDLEDEDGD